MIYVLAIGIETEVYENPSLEVFLNNQLLGMTDIKESLLAETQKHKKVDILTDWQISPVTNPEKIYTISMPKKWIVFEIDDNVLDKKNTLDIQFKNLKTNITNGFMTKMDKCKIIKTIFMPKNWFSSNGMQEIFNYCDERNVVIETNQRGWPSANPQLAPIENLDTVDPVDGEYNKKLKDDNIDVTLHEDMPILNNNANHEIIYDEILELYRFAEANNQMPTHMKITDILAKANEMGDQVRNPYWKGGYTFKAWAPQKITTNSETTLLQIDQSSKLYINQITTKY